MKNRKFSVPDNGIFRVIVLFVLGFLIYSNTFHASFHLDDGGSIVNNPAIRNLWNLKAIWDFLPTRFFTYFSLACNYHFHQLSLPGYHLLNLAIHLGTAMLVSWLVLLLLSTPTIKDSPVARHAKLISLLAGLIFVAHPIQTQAITYITQRTASLAAFFYLLSVCLYLRARLNQAHFSESLRGSGSDRGNPNRDCRANRARNDITIYYLGSLLAAIAAFFTKESAVTLPFMLLLCEVSFFRNNTKNIIKRLAPFFFILVVFLIVFRLTGPGRISEISTLKETQSDLTAITPAQYLLTQFRVITTYLRLIFVPINQNLDYNYPIARTLWTIQTFSGFLLLLSILTTAVLLFRKHRFISFGIFWFFLSLVPESSVLPIRDVIFEHRLYLPMVGYSIFLPIAAYYLAGDKRRKSAFILLLAIITCYSVMTYARNRVWKDEITLWSDVIQKSPNKARPWGNRGMAYSLSGEYAKALADCNQAIKINPSSGANYCNRASVYHAMAEYDLAVADYTRAIAFQPDLSAAYFNRGFSYEKKGNYDQAIADWSRVVAFNPHDADAYFNRGRMHSQKEEYDQAIADYSLVVKNDPLSAEAYFNRGNAYRHKKMYPDALFDYTQTLKINPLYGEAYNNRAATLIVLGKYPQARKDIQKMEELGYPFNPTMRKFLSGSDN